MPTYTCRICLEESENRSDFIVPCRCSGSSKYVHRVCLDTWRSQDPDGANFRRCNTCHFNYELVHASRDPRLEARRQREYKRSITMDVVIMIIVTLVTIALICGILYGIDMATSGSIRNYMYGKFRLRNAVAIFLIITVVLLVLVVGIVTVFTLPLGSLHHTDFSMAAAMPITPELFLGTGIIMGLAGGTYHIYRYVNSSRRKHRQRIWLQQEAQIEQVRDFGEAGPPVAA